MKLNHKALALVVFLSVLPFMSQTVMAKDSSNLKKGKIAGVTLGATYNEVVAIIPTLGVGADMGQCQKVTNVLNNSRTSCVLSNTSNAQVKGIPVNEFKIIFNDSILEEVALTFDLPVDYKKPQKELLDFMRNEMYLNEYRIKREIYSSFKRDDYFGGFSTYYPPEGGAQVVISYSLKSKKP